MKYYFSILLLFFSITNSQNINQLIDRYKNILINTNKANPIEDKSPKYFDQQKYIKKFISVDEYLLGPNDILNININSSEYSESYSKEINFSGYIMLPYHGKIFLKGKSIRLAEEKIASVLRKNYPEVRVDVSINSHREFSVLVKWGFNKSLYVGINSFFRLSDVIEKIYSMNELNKDSFASLKKIRHIRRNKMQIIDLQDFYLTDNFDYNPLIIEEDVIEIIEAIDFIFIKGDQVDNCIYEFNEDETYYNLLSKISLDVEILNRNRVLVYRSNRFFSKISTLDESKKIKLLRDDVVIINPKNNYYNNTINLTGQVMFPGIYLIDYKSDSESMSLNEVIKLAGGLLENADLSNISIHNDFINKMEDNELEKIKIIFENEDISKKINESDISYVRNRFLFPRGSIKSKSAKHGEQLLEMKLFPGDEISIPIKLKFIEVLGAVKFPGRIAFKEDLTATEYIVLAGGINNNYNKKYIIKKETGEKVKFSDEINLSSGDIIFISDTIDYNNWEYFKEMLSVMSQIATIIIVINQAIN